MAATESVWRRLTKLFRSGPVVRHKISRAEPMREPVGSARAYKKQISSLYVSSMASYGQFERLSRYCFTAEQRVAVTTTEGSIPIGEIVSRFTAGERFDTISYNPETKEMEARPIVGALSMGEREIWNVTLDDGSVVRCTGDHPFMLRDGSYRRVDELTPGVALMPVTRKKFNGYQYVLSDGRGWTPEHVLVAETADGVRLGRDSGMHVHHLNFDRTDNRRENLRVIPAADHLALHARINNMRFADPAEREKQAVIARARWAPGGDLRRKLESGEFCSPAGKRARVESITRRNRERPPRLDRSLTFQMICDAYVPGKTLEQICSELGVYRNKALRRLSSEGFRNFGEFVSNYRNHKVIAVERTGTIEPVYDIEVEGLHNFALCNSDGKSLIIVHNCDYTEMCYMPEIASGLDIYADEICARDEQGRMLRITSKNDDIKQILETLFYDIIDIEFNIWSWVRNLCKNGDLALFVDATEGNGILNLLPIPINEIEREEGFDKDDPFAIRYRWLTQGNTILENWQVIHFRLLGDDGFLPYGYSILEPARRIWRQLVLIEDAMLVYRIVRSPERRVFKVPVGSISSEEVPRFMEEFITSMKRNQIIDHTTGRVDLRYNAMSVDEDYFFPYRGEVGPTVESLPGGQFTGDIDDVQYIQNKLFAALKIPKAYLGYDGDVGSKATLAQEDVRFAKTIERIQKIVVAELNKIAIVHLFLMGYTGDDLVNFKIDLAAPSTIAEQQKLELWRMRFEVAGMAQEGMFDKDTVRERIFGLNPEEIQRIKERIKLDKLEEMALQSIQAPGSEGSGGAGGDVSPEDGEVPGEPLEDVPGAGDLPGTLGGPEPQQEEGLDVSLMDVFNPGSTGDRAEIATDKGKDLFAPAEDLAAHVFGTDKQTASDPFDRRAQRRMITRPFSEEEEPEGYDVDLSELESLAEARVVAWFGSNIERGRELDSLLRQMERRSRTQNSPSRRVRARRPLLT